MTEHYYSQEDQPVETSENALANWQAQSSSLAGFIPRLAEDLTRAEQLLGQMYAEAEQAGNAAVQEGVSAVWNILQEKANEMAQLDAAREAAMTVIRMIDEDRKKAEKNYDELNSAVENMDSDDPRVASLIEDIEEDVYQYVEDQIEDYAYDNAWENVHDIIQLSTGMSWQRVYRFVGFLRGYREITDEQRALMVTLLQSFNAEMDEVELPRDDEYEVEDE